MIPFLFDVISYDPPRHDTRMHVTNLAQMPGKMDNDRWLDRLAKASGLGVFPAPRFGRCVHFSPLRDRPYFIPHNVRFTFFVRIGP